MSLRFIQHSFGQADGLAKRALELLVARSIPPSPLNFTVAYEYFGGINPELTAALDKLLAGDEAVDAYVLRDLYERHVASDQYKNLRGMGDDLQTLLSSLVQSVSEAGTGVAVFGATVARHMGSLHGANGPDAVRAIAADLLAATADIQTRNRTLQERLEETHKETESLRKELEQHRREALIDPLTGLYNRRALESRLDEWQVRPLAVVMLDIDHFKRINDSYGHAVGDVVIRNVADTLRKCVRGDDFAVRYGGEEFVVLLPDTGLDGAIKVAETIRKRIEALRLVRRQDNFTLAPFTISAGVAERRGGDDHDSLFQRVDAALYESKSRGRNCVTHEGQLH
ncbi:GGDEF domain-containing protein [Parasulfuritortus cantonensis]|uniref:diguanylate cyclase n=1 Tax=Parasulfuritortus cantonensis TaxID=2528202 RepID=A0A4R1B4N1_9PROT|nr:GGDEF domain-containing protein [Parasulfuritortus cantonensis]TCJ12891.1 GGDEF domain-containing protein [Parasulfuritortus cantonensis]